MGIGGEVKQYLIRTKGPVMYQIYASRFDIMNGIAYFFDEEGEVCWVVREWTTFSTKKIQELPKTPDEFYERLNNDEDENE